MSEKNNLVTIDPKEYGLEKKEVKSIEEAFSPKIIERDALAKIYESIITKELNPETIQEARELRLKLVKVRTGIKRFTQHKKLIS